VVVIVVAVIGWKVFAPSGSSPTGGATENASAREAHFKEHPEHKAIFDSMNSKATPPGGGGAPAGRTRPAGSMGMGGR
jgi:hypothetical protein